MLPAAEWEVEGGMKGGEASSPAAREGGGGGEVFLWAGPWTPLEGWMGFRGPAPLRTAPPPVGSVCVVGGWCHFLRRVLLALGASLMRTGKGRSVGTLGAWGQVFPRARHAVKRSVGMRRTHVLAPTSGSCPHCTRRGLRFERKRQRRRLCRLRDTLKDLRGGPCPGQPLGLVAYKTWCFVE